MALMIIMAAIHPVQTRAEKPLRLAVTTSLEHSGLLGFLQPMMEQAIGAPIHVLVAGTGSALAAARHGNVDLVIAHAEPLEKALIEDGISTARHLLMYNDFVIVGPHSDDAKIEGHDPVRAFARIHGAGAMFVSRGDQSGTNIREQQIWQQAELDPESGPGRYVQTGSGQAATLRIASEWNAYMLCDLASFLNAPGHHLRVLVSDHPALSNPYSVLDINPAHHPHTNHLLASQLIEWLISGPGQHAIASFRVKGNQLFRPARQLEAKPFLHQPIIPQNRFASSKPQAGLEGI